MKNSFPLALTAIMLATTACPAGLMSRFLHSRALIDDGKLLLPTIIDIITGEPGTYAQERPFGRVVLTAPHRLVDDDEPATEATLVDAVLAYFHKQAGGYPVELVEDYRRAAGDTFSVCFSQAVRGVRIYGTAACADVHGGQLRDAWHLFVVPPSICTEPEVMRERALDVVKELANKGGAQASEFRAELNLVFVHGTPRLTWRVWTQDAQDSKTYFVDAKDGRLVALTAAAYRSRSR